MTYEEEFSKYPEDYQNLLSELVAEYNLPLEDIEQELGEYIVSDLDDYISKSSRRHWTDLTMVVKINNRYFQFEWANADGDTSIEDLGWEFDKSSVKEVVRETKQITKTIVTYKSIKKERK